MPPRMNATLLDRLRLPLCTAALAAGCGGPDRLTLAEIPQTGPSIEGFTCAAEPCEVVRLADTGVLHGAAAVAGDFAYYVDERAGGLFRAPLAGDAPPAVILEGARGHVVSDGDTVLTVIPPRLAVIDGPTGDAQPSDVECGYRLGIDRSSVFVAQDEDTVVERLPLDGGNPEPVGAGRALRQLMASDRWICWAGAGHTACASAEDGSQATSLAGADQLVNVDDAFVYFLDRDHNLLRAPLPGGTSEMVFPSTEGLNSAYAFGDGARLYFAQSVSWGGRRILRLNKHTGAIDLLGYTATGLIAGGDDRYLLLDAPLRRITR